MLVRALDEGLAAFGVGGTLFGLDARLGDWRGQIEGVNLHISLCYSHLSLMFVSVIEHCGCSGEW